MTHQAYIIKNKKIFILGLGLSGISAARELSKLGAEIYIFDDNKSKEQILNIISEISANENKANQIKYCHYQEANWENIDYLLMSPGIPSTFPKPHEAVVLAKQHSVKLTVDIELFVVLIPNANIIAITGTNGKSTTASLIHHVLSNNGKQSYLGGNIGVPVFELEINNNSDQYYILELSSYQLELVEKASFDISILLNITADHIDRHGNMENYIAAKKRIFNNSKPNQTFIISVDDKYCMEIYNEFKELPASGITENKNTAISISNDNEKADISFLSNMIKYYDEQINFTKESAYFGNKQNIIAAFSVAKLCDIENDNIIAAMASFKPLQYRMELLSKKGNISFYNDSKATNAESSLNAIKQLKNIYWIAGGVSKSGGIELITENYLDNIKKVFLIGESQKYFAKQLEDENFYSYQSYETLEDALTDAISGAKDESDEINILFSPAAASFDMWKNFVERGKDFSRLCNTKK